MDGELETGYATLASGKWLVPLCFLEMDARTHAVPSLNPQNPLRAFAHMLGEDAHERVKALLPWPK